MALKMALPSNLTKQQGATLIEILMATMIVGTVLTAVAATLLYSLKANLQSKYRSLAAQKAQEAIDFFRRERTVLGWSIFYQVVDADTYCLPSIPSPPSRSLTDHVFAGLTKGGCSDYNLSFPNEEINFKREAIVSLDDPNTITIEVTVSWPNAKLDEPYSVTLQQELNNW